MSSKDRPPLGRKSLRGSIFVAEKVEEKDERLPEDSFVIQQSLSSRAKWRIKKSPFSYSNAGTGSRELLQSTRASDMRSETLCAAGKAKAGKRRFPLEMIPGDTSNVT